MSERFTREEQAPAALEELFDRLEKQAVAIARLRGQIRTLQKELAAEREERSRLQTALDAQAPAAAADEDMAELVERNRVLEHQVEVAWAQLGVLENQRDEKRGRWRRRGRTTLPPTS